MKFPGPPCLANHSSPPAHRALPPATSLPATHSSCLHLGASKGTQAGSMMHLPALHYCILAAGTKSPAGPRTWKSSPGRAGSELPPVLAAWRGVWPQQPRQQGSHICRQPLFLLGICSDRVCSITQFFERQRVRAPTRAAAPHPEASPALRHGTQVLSSPPSRNPQAGRRSFTTNESETVRRRSNSLLP